MSGLASISADKFGIGLSNADVETLNSLGQAAYGKKEGLKGGKGYIGVFIDQLGECHTVKDPAEKKLIPHGYVEQNFGKLMGYYRAEIALEDV